MKILVLVALVSLTAPVGAWEIQENPDRYPSIGVEVSGGKLAGMQKAVPAGAPATNGGFVKGHLDLRFPVNGYLTLSLIGESTGINNNLQFSEGNRVGFGMRVYVK